jgi:hypothetical protein
MITKLSSYTAMIDASLSTTKKNAASSAAAASGLAPADSVDISASSDVFGAVDSFFDLGKSNRFEDFHKLSPADQEKFIQIVATLSKSGYAGYQELKVGGQIERHDVLDEVVDERVRGARVYDETTRTFK